MDDMSNGLGAVQTAYAQVLPTERVEPQKMYTQEQVNAFVANVKKEAFSSAQKMQAEQPEYFAQKHAVQYAAADNEAQRIAKNDEMRKLVAEELNAQKQKWQQDAYARQQEQRYQNVYSEFKNKEKTGAQKYEDFSERVNEEGLAPYVNLVAQVIETTDNADDVLYHLAADPERMWSLEQAAQADARNNTKIGVGILKKISSQLKEKGSRDLQDLKPATNAFIKKLASSANIAPPAKEHSVSDYKKMYRM